MEKKENILYGFDYSTNSIQWCHQENMDAWDLHISRGEPSCFWDGPRPTDSGFWEYKRCPLASIKDKNCNLGCPYASLRKRGNKEYYVVSCCGSEKEFCILG